VRLAAASKEALDAALVSLGFAAAPRGVPRVGEIRLCNLLSVDHGLLVRWNDTSADLFPHGGALVQRQLIQALTHRGIPALHGPIEPWQSRQPAAGDELEARMLDALARAVSPRAVDVLLAAPAAWRSSSVPWHSATRSPRDARLNRLIDPPLVALVGAANIGKSTLINALARQAVSIVDAQPGSTRDHVGVLIQLDGLVARVVDTPGIRATSDPIEQQAQQTAMTMAAAADLLLLCGDAATPPPAEILPAIPALRVALRADLGPASWSHDASRSAARREGIDELAILIRQRLVPDADLRSSDPWVFW